MIIMHAWLARDIKILHFAALSVRLGEMWGGTFPGLVMT